MTRKEAFETFHKKRMCLQVAMTGNHGFHKDYAYSDAQVAWNAWNAACDWQKAQDIKAVTNEYLVEPTTQADDLAYDQAIFDAINAIRKEDTSAR